MNHILIGIGIITLLFTLLGLGLIEVAMEGVLKKSTKIEKGTIIFLIVYLASMVILFSFSLIIDGGIK